MRAFVRWLWSRRSASAAARWEQAQLPTTCPSWTAEHPAPDILRCELEHLHGADSTGLALKGHVAHDVIGRTWTWDSGHQPKLVG